MWPKLRNLFDSILDVIIYLPKVIKNILGTQQSITLFSMNKRPSNVLVACLIVLQLHKLLMRIKGEILQVTGKDFIPMKETEGKLYSTQKV